MIGTSTFRLKGTPDGRPLPNGKSHKGRYCPWKLSRLPRPPEDPSVFALKRLVWELVTHLSISQAIRISIGARVFEDHQAALSLANNHRITSRTRYRIPSCLLVGYNYHWFWERGRTTHLSSSVTKSTQNRLNTPRCGLLHQGIAPAPRAL